MKTFIIFYVFIIIILSFQNLGDNLFNNIDSIARSDKLCPSQEFTKSNMNQWPMYRYNAQHIGKSPYTTGENPGGERWKFFSPKSISYHSPLIDANGILYCPDEFHKIYAIYPNGTIKWQRDLTGNNYMHQPALGTDGTIYLGTDKHFYALYSNGTTKWILPIQNHFCSDPVIGSDDTIYAGTINGSFYAINPNGTVNWTYNIGYRIIGASIDSKGNIYFTGRYADYLYCLNPDGSLRWKFEAHMVMDAPTIGENDTIYIDTDYYLIAINPNGTEKWKMHLPGFGTSPSIAPDGTLVFSSYQGPLVAGVKPDDGSILWSYRTNSDSRYKTPPCIGNDGTIYFAEDSGYLYALTSNGLFKWRTRLTTEYTPYDGMYVESSPSIDSNGIVYVTSWFYRGGSNYTDIGYIHAIGGVKMQIPQEGYIYLFGRDVCPALLGSTIIIGRLSVQVATFHEENVEYVEFIIDNRTRYVDSSPPFEWFLKGLLFGKHTLSIKGYYTDGAISEENMKIISFII